MCQKIKEKRIKLKETKGRFGQILNLTGFDFDFDRAGSTPKLVEAKLNIFYLRFTYLNK